MRDQMGRAARSIANNIAEGTGRSGRDGQRFFRIARGSANECAAMLNEAKDWKLVDEVVYGQGRRLLYRIVCMLSRMGGSG